MVSETVARDVDAVLEEPLIRFLAACRLL